MKPRRADAKELERSGTSKLVHTMRLHGVVLRAHKFVRGA
jgi:hypothetical protein